MPSNCLEESQAMVIEVIPAIKMKRMPIGPSMKIDAMIATRVPIIIGIVSNAC